MSMRQQIRRLTSAVLWLAAFLSLMLSDTNVQAGGQPGEFDLYILSLSWSPEYCAGHQNDAAQCAADRHEGLVVHGLWPQFSRLHRDPETGATVAWPDYCPAPHLGSLPSAAATVWPSSNLFRHEWQAHGSCTGLPPADYVDLTGKLRQRFQTPQPLQPSAADQTIGAADLQAAIGKANPDLPQTAVTLACRKGRLTEIRLCLDRGPDHGYVACPVTPSGGNVCPRNIVIRGLSD
jgi:ribonuclease T2